MTHLTTFPQPFSAAIFSYYNDTPKNSSDKKIPIGILLNAPIIQVVTQEPVHESKKGTQFRVSLLIFINYQTEERFDEKIAINLSKIPWHLLFPL